VREGISRDGPRSSTYAFKVKEEPSKGRRRRNLGNTLTSNISITLTNPQRLLISTVHHEVRHLCQNNRQEYFAIPQPIAELHPLHFTTIYLNCHAPPGHLDLFLCARLINPSAPLINHGSSSCLIRNSANINSISSSTFTSTLSSPL
jgi:hypothetical protein